MDSVKWTGKVPVRTAITDTCEGQVSAALLQWQVLQFFTLQIDEMKFFLSCWILTQIAKWTNMLNWDRQINLPATSWWFLDVNVVAEKSDKRVRKQIWGQKVWWNLTGKNYTEFL